MNIDVKDVQFTGSRTAIFAVQVGDTVVTREVQLPLGSLVFRGPWRVEKSYAGGDCCTRGGSLWLTPFGAEGDVEKPGSSNCWRLIARRGTAHRSEVTVNAKFFPTTNEAKTI